MIELVYRQHKTRTPLAGKTVAEVRQQYGTRLGVQGEARAVLNNRTIERHQEPAAVLTDGDELRFVNPGRSRVPLLATALLLALAITGGAFAYSYTTSSTTLTLTPATYDFASVSDVSGRIHWRPFGSSRGIIPPGYLFGVIPALGYTGDLSISVYLSNTDQLSKNYSALMMRLQLVNNIQQPVDAEGITQVLSLENGVASFYFPSSNFTAGTQYYVKVLGGTYIALPFVSGGFSTTYDPKLYCQVGQG